MPPFIPYKSALSNPPPDVPMPKSNMTESLFDTADKPGASSSLQDNRAFLEQLDASSTESSLSDISTDAFEDVLSPPPSKRPKVMHYEHGEDEIDWEDIQTVVGPSTRVAPEPSGNLELTLDNSARMKFSMNPLDKKKGPSKIERRIRISTHRMHVQYLLFHNLIRNGWACDKEVQATLISQLPDGIRKEIDKWKVATGVSSATTTQTSNVPLRNGKRAKMAEQSKRNQRDWGRPAERQEKGANMSRGDPLIRLLKVLAAYWKKHFIITAPGLRKQGYKSLATIEEELASYKKNNNYDPVEYGERVESVQEFRRLAHKCEGSRDIGVLLFTSLVRGLEVEARLVASLQPLGFGWTKNEEASGKKRKVLKPLLLNHAEVASHSNEESEVAAPKTASTPDHNSHKPTTTVGKKRRARGAVDSPIDLSKDLSNDSGNDDASVIDVTPPTFRKRLNMDFDKDMQFPTYWTEVISPITNEVQPVDPLVLNPAVPTNPEQLAFFEPRGANADKAKQVFAYVVAYSPDGTAKEVTTRYLKRHVWPGRTKGSRLPIEKVPVHDRRGKIKFHEDYDWFKNLMRAYARTDDMRTAVDDLEEVKDLVAVKYEKKETNARDETLQGYKNSAEFVLERHLRREEALLPGSKPVKTFLSGKGDKAKKEPVYRRSDVEVCRTGESWHKEGRAVRRGEYPMKMVPVRAVTLTRKREVEEAERDGGEKLKQGLYALHQTDWIIPPPIENGVIPKNAFGNMDCYVPTMVPKGAVHIPLKSTVKICKRLGIDFAEAVTGFEFGQQRAVPIITGVVIAEENEPAVIDEWEKDEEERKIKEEGKREKTALSTWRKWLMGLRIIQRVREEYGGDADAHLKEDMNPFTNQSKTNQGPPAALEPWTLQNGEAFDPDHGDMRGGFLADDDVGGGGFLDEGHSEDDVARGTGELIIAEDDKITVEAAGPPLALSEGDGHILNPDDHDDHDDHDEGSIKQKRRLKPTLNGKGSEKSRRKISSIPASKTGLKNNRKRRASTESSVLGDGGHADPPLAPPSRKTRKARKGSAARKSEQAVRSHYFDHDSSVGGEAHKEDEG